MIIWAIVLIFVVMAVLKLPSVASISNPLQTTSLALGFILIFAFLLGKITGRFKLPQITGFIVAGIICGPYLFGFLSRNDVQNLQLLDGLALSLIALTAGGEMRLKELRSRFRTIGLLTLFQTFLIIAGFIALSPVLKAYIPFFAGQSLAQVFVFALLLGTLATATSPSTTIAIINETKAKGRTTDLILSTAVVKDFFVITFFALSLSFSKSFLTPGQDFDIGFLFGILRDVGGSVAIGLALGGLIILYLKYIRRDITVFILGVAFFTYQISHHEGFHPLMICLVAGFMVENFSSLGEKFIQAIEKSSLPVYVIFFAISGASINLNALRSTWYLALIFVIWRGFLKFSGTYFGARLSGESGQFQRRSWAGFISQAGVALGMAIVVERTFPEWGGMFKTLVLAIIALNQIVGPILLQRLLFSVGEAGRKTIIPN
jgi:Kef-type K+ transport system membrane component KefB